MTPQEKAKELVDKMLYCYQGHIDEYTAKQCALIAVDELIEVASDYCDYDETVTKEYWQEVKQEIENL